MSKSLKTGQNQESERHMICLVALIVFLTFILISLVGFSCFIRFHTLKKAKKETEDLEDMKHRDKYISDASPRQKKWETKFETSKNTNLWGEIKSKRSLTNMMPLMRKSVDYHNSTDNHSNQPYATSIFAPEIFQTPEGSLSADDIDQLSDHDESLEAELEEVLKETHSNV